MTAGASRRWRLVSLPHITERRGSLCVAEAAAQVPFDIERVFWIFDIPADARRACHAHRQQHEFIVALHGSFVVRLEGGGLEEEYLLDAPDKGLFIPELVWVELRDFSTAAVCLAFASGPYEEADNLRDYGEYKRLTGERT